MDRAGKMRQHAPARDQSLSPGRQARDAPEGLTPAERAWAGMAQADQQPEQVQAQLGRGEKALEDANRRLNQLEGAGRPPSSEMLLPPSWRESASEEPEGGLAAAIEELEVELDKAGSLGPEPAQVPRGGRKTLAEEAATKRAEMTAAKAEKRIGELESAVAELSRELSVAKHMESGLQRELEEAVQQVANADAIQDGLRKELQKAMQESVAWESEYSVMVSSQGSVARDEIKQLQAQLGQERARCTEAEGELDGLLDNAQKALDHEIMEKDQLSLELRDVKVQLQVFEEELASIEGDHATKLCEEKERSQQLEQKLSQSEQKLAGTLKADATSEALRQRNFELEEQLRLALNSKEDLLLKASEKIQALEAEAATAAERHNTEMLAEQSNTVSRMTQMKAGMEHDWAEGEKALKAALAERESVVQSLETERDALTTQLSVKVDALASASRRAADAESVASNAQKGEHGRLEVQQERVKQLEQQAEGLQQQAATAISVQEGLQRELQKAVQESVAWESEYTKALSGQDERTVELRRECEEELKKERNKRNEVEGELEALLDHVDGSVQKLSEEKDELAKQLAFREEALSNASSRMMELDEQLSALTEAKTAADISGCEMEADLKLKSAGLDQALTKINVLEGLLEAIEKTNAARLEHAGHSPPAVGMASQETSPLPRAELHQEFTSEERASIFEGDAKRIAELKEQFEHGEMTGFEPSEPSENVTGLVVRLLMRIPGGLLSAAALQELIAAAGLVQVEAQVAAFRTMSQRLESSTRSLLQCLVEHWQRIAASSRNSITHNEVLPAVEALISTAPFVYDQPSPASAPAPREAPLFGIPHTSPSAAQQAAEKRKMEALIAEMEARHALRLGEAHQQIEEAQREISDLEETIFRLKSVEPDEQDSQVPGLQQEVQRWQRLAAESQANAEEFRKELDEARADSKQWQDKYAAACRNRNAELYDLQQALLQSPSKSERKALKQQIAVLDEEIGNIHGSPSVSLEPVAPEMSHGQPQATGTDLDRQIPAEVTPIDEPQPVSTSDYKYRYGPSRFDSISQYDTTSRSPNLQQGAPSPVELRIRKFKQQYLSKGSSGL